MFADMPDLREPISFILPGGARLLTACAALLLYVCCSLQLPMAELAHGLSHLFEGNGHHHHSPDLEIETVGHQHLHEQTVAHHHSYGGAHHHGLSEDLEASHAYSHSRVLLTLLDLKVDEGAGRSELPSEKKKIEQLDKHYPSLTYELELTVLLSDTDKPLYSNLALIDLRNDGVVSPPPERQA